MPNTIAGQVPPAPEPLRPWFTGVRAFSPAGRPEETLVHLPAAATKVVLRMRADGRRDVLAVGPRVRASYHPGKQGVSCVELWLAPGAVRPLLGVAATELVGRAIALSALPGAAASRLAAALHRLEPRDPLPELTGTLPASLPAVDPARTALLRAGVDALSVHPDRAPARVREVAGELAVSERQLRNLFADGVGVSPKHYARIDRVRTIITRAPTTPWAQLAAATGYYDQSHMTTDFRALMGVPPRAYFTDRLPARSPCGARLG
ncbi:helix-turn-helix domain-containing protein [Streptomyces murinus]